MLDIDVLCQKHKRVFFAFLVILIIYSLAHFLYSGVYYPVAQSGITSYMEEFANVKNFASIKAGTREVLHPYVHYGPTFYLLNYPIKDCTKVQLNYGILFINYIFLFWMFLICVKVFIPQDKKNKAVYVILLAVLFFNFRPFYEVTSWRNVEIFELFLMCLALYSFLRGRRVLCGIFLSLAALTKMLPLVFIFYIFFKDRKAFISSVISGAVLMLIATYAFGNDVGFLYLPHLLTRAVGGYDPGFFENTSLKGLIYRIFAGFRWSNETLGFVLNGKAAAWAEMSSKILQAAGMLFLAFISFSRYKHKDGNKIMLEFGLASLFAIMLAPFSNYGYATLTFLAFAVIFYYMITKPASISKPVIVSSAIGYFLVGNFLPLTFAKYLPWEQINNFFGNTSTVEYLGKGKFLYWWQSYCIPTFGYISVFIALFLIIKRNGFLKLSLQNREG